MSPHPTKANEFDLLVREGDGEIKLPRKSILDFYRADFDPPTTKITAAKRRFLSDSLTQMILNIAEVYFLREIV